MWACSVSIIAVKGSEGTTIYESRTQDNNSTQTETDTKEQTGIKSTIEINKKDTTNVE